MRTPLVAGGSTTLSVTDRCHEPLGNTLRVLPINIAVHLKCTRERDYTPLGAPRWTFVNPRIRSARSVSRRAAINACLSDVVLSDDRSTADLDRHRASAARKSADRCHALMSRMHHHTKPRRSSRCSRRDTGHIAFSYEHATEFHGSSPSCCMNVSTAHASPITR